MLLPLTGLYAAVVAVELPKELAQDSWMTLVSGREIARHGLPSHDHLTVWASGVHWVDQQWLAQIAFYGVDRLGGIKLAMLVHLAILVATVVVGLVAARSLGGSNRAVMIVALPAMFVAPWGLQMRAQTLGELLFVLLLWLLAADARRPSAKVFAFVPLLALWGNVHGSVVLGALLVSLRGVAFAVTELRAVRPSPRWKLRAAALTVGAWPLLLASPYATGLAGYYHTLVLDPPFAGFIQEWSHTTPSMATALFFVLAASTCVLLVRRAPRVVPFDALVLIITAAAAFWAIRNIVWFGLACLVLLPAVVDAGRSARSLPSRLVRPGALLGGVAIAAALIFVASKPGAWFVQAWPAAASEAVARAAAGPSTRVLADDRFADWLLWEQPSLRGRVAYDARSELFTGHQFASLARFKGHEAPGWARAAEGYGLLVADPVTEHAEIRAVESRLHAHRLYEDGHVTVLRLPGGIARGRRPVSPVSPLPPP